MGGNRRQKFKQNQKLPERVENFPEEFSEVLEAVPVKNRNKVANLLVGITSQMKIYSGPIPSPEMLKQYDEIYPGLAKEIVEHGLSETKHRHKLEDQALPYEISRMKRGQLFGFILAILALAASMHLASTGHDWVAGIIGGSTLIGLITVFVLGKTVKTKGKPPVKPPSQ